MSETICHLCWCQILGWRQIPSQGGYEYDMVMKTRRLVDRKVDQPLDKLMKPKSTLQVP